jgi:hypothetical protein
MPRPRSCSNALLLPEVGATTAQHLLNDADPRLKIQDMPQRDYVDNAMRSYAPIGAARSRRLAMTAGASAQW